MGAGDGEMALHSQLLLLITNKINLKHKLRHRWSECNSGIQIVCWGRTRVGNVAKLCELMVCQQLTTEPTEPKIIKLQNIIDMSYSETIANQNVKMDIVVQLKGFIWPKLWPMSHIKGKTNISLVSNKQKHLLLLFKFSLFALLPQCHNGHEQYVAKFPLNCGLCATHFVQCH